MRHSDVGLFHFYDSKLRVIQLLDIETKKKEILGKLPWEEYAEYSNTVDGDIIITIEHWYLFYK